MLVWYVSRSSFLFYGSKEAPAKHHPRQNLKILKHQQLSLIDQVASGVQIEPRLELLTVEMLQSGSITEECAKGFWQTHKMS